jgi:hypothetical protein
MPIVRSTASSTRLTTNSCVARTLSAVSFGWRSSRSPGQNPMIGGLAPSALKKLNGAAFKCPSRLSEVTHAMGLRVTSDRAPSRPGRDRSKRLELKQADKSSLEIDGKSPVIEGVRGWKSGGPATIELFGSAAIIRTRWLILWRRRRIAPLFAGGRMFSAKGERQNLQRQRWIMPLM